jgi:hypothetical protein
MNGSEQTQEITIDFPFGYPTTNNQGNIQMVYDDSARAAKWGISDVIRGFPKSFTLQPGQRQVVRLTIRPREFEDRMYWSRIRTTSTPVSPPVGETQEDAVTTRITYKFEQVTTVFYKHGDINTGLDVQNLTTNQTDDQVQFIADLSRTGNAPFLGSLMLSINDQQGNTVVEKRTSTSIYFDYRQVFNIAKDQLTKGNYTAEFKILTQRGDVSNSDILQIEPIVRRINLTVK